MRILFVHEVNYRRKVVFEMHDFPELLSLRGHEVTFFDFVEDEPRSGIRRLLDLGTTVGEVSSRAHEGAKVTVVTPGAVVPARAARLAAPVVQTPRLWRLLATGRWDAVVLYGVPTNGWQALSLAHHYGVPVLFRALDVSHALRPTRYERLIKVAEQFIYRKADAISANNVALRDYVIAHGAAPERVTVEYPGIDLDRFVPAARSVELMERYGIRDTDRVALFMGTLYRFGGLGWLIERLAPHLRKDSNAKLVLVGGGEAEALLRERVAVEGVADQVVFTGVAAYPELADHLRLGDVAINTFDEELVTRCALPSKVLQYAACGLPTVCTRLDGMKGLLAEGEGILYRAPGDAFVDAVVDLLGDPGRSSALGARAREIMERDCSWDRAVGRIEDLLTAMVAQRAPVA